MFSWLVGGGAERLLLYVPLVQILVFLKNHHSLAAGCIIAHLVDVAGRAVFSIFDRRIRLVQGPTTSTLHTGVRDVSYGYDCSRSLPIHYGIAQGWLEILLLNTVVSPKYHLYWYGIE